MQFCPIRAITYDKYSDLEISDPYNLIKHADIDITQKGNHSVFTFDVVFSDEVETSDVLFRVWDMKRNPLNLHVADALEVMLAEPTPEESISELISTDPEPILSESITVDPEPIFSWEVFNQWAGYSEHGISDEEFLDHIGIEAKDIPHWVKQNNAKWVKEGKLLQQDLIAVLENLKNRGII